MQQLRKLLFCILVFVWVIPSLGATKDFVSPPVNRPVVVQIGFAINDITKISERNETVTFEGMLTERWHDKRLAFDPVQAGTKIKYYTSDAAVKKLNQIWNPQIILRDLRGKPQIYATYLTIDASGEVTYGTRFLATVENRLNFVRFPFEKQFKFFAFQSHLYDASIVELQRLKMKEGFYNPTHLDEWQILDTKIKTSANYNPSFQKVFSQYTLEVIFVRQSLFYFMQTILPLVLIVLFSFSAFWMIQDPLVNRSMVSLTALLTIVVFQWRISGILPHISYLTFLDVLLLYSFMIVVIGLFPSLLYNHLQNEKTKMKLIRTCRWAFPVFYLLGILIITLIYFA